MLRTQIYLPASQLKRLKKTAWEQNSSVSEVIRDTLEEKFETKTSKKMKNDNVGDWLLSLEKEVRKLKVSGPKDLSKNVDKYLYGGK